MSKHIVVCMDGTWNDPTERTNVYKLFRLLPGAERRVEEADTIRQHYVKDAPGCHALYLEGVGARNRRQGVVGGSLGVGLHDRIVDSFVLISRIYQPGDCIWIFGFSRGAWSARGLAGLIAGAGLLDQPTAAAAPARAEALWLEYKHGLTQTRGDAFWAANPQPIEAVGVWDTVGALGIPFFNGLRLIDRVEKNLFDFADPVLSPRVRHGRQALAIDETRFDFTPSLWAAREGVTQVWFPGVHSDVGGGYPHSGLSDIALAWMVDEINALGTGLKLDIANLGSDYAPDALADRHEEATGMAWKLRPRRPRQIGPDATLAPAVLARLAQRPDYRPEALLSVPLCLAYYPPGCPKPAETLQPEKELPPQRRLKPGESRGCVVFAQKWWNAAGVAVEPNERYRIEAQGQWVDKTTPAGPAGYASDNSVLRHFEGSRRLGSAPWFALVAALHSDESLELKNPVTDNMVFGAAESFVRGVARVDGESRLISTGAEGEILADRKGILYFFANDSAFAYANNSGYLDVRITRLS